MNRKTEESAKAKAAKPFSSSSVTGPTPGRSQSARQLGDGKRLSNTEAPVATPKRRETAGPPSKEASRRRESVREPSKEREPRKVSEEPSKEQSKVTDGESSGIGERSEERRSRKVSEELRDQEQASSEVPEAGETDSFDEELELLRCQAELVEVAADLGTTSADDDFLTTDLDEGNVQDDEDDGLYRRAPMQRLGVRNVVIEEDDEDISMDFEEHAGGDWENDSSEVRSRLWAQSLLRLKRSIDEIYSLCEFESEESACEQVKEILAVASDDFGALIKRLETQQEYALLNNDLGFKHGVAWTTRAPTTTAPRPDSPRRVSDRGRNPRLEDLVTSHTSSSGMSRQSKTDHSSRRSMSLDARLAKDACEQEVSGGGTGEAFGGRDFLALQPSCHSPHSPGASSTGGRSNQLNQMVQSALQRIRNRPLRSPEEIQQRTEERQRRAQKVRASFDDQRMHHCKQLDHRILAAKERRMEKERQMQRELLEKMTKARRQYQEQLHSICQRARNENRKSAEVQYIHKETPKGERELLKRKQENAQLSRAIMRETMRSRLLESASRIEQAAERRRKEQEQWQTKITKDLENKARTAMERRQELLHSKKEKAEEQMRRSELANEKRNEQEREEEKSSKSFLKVRSQVISRLGLDTDGLPDGAKQEVIAQLHSREEGGGRPGSTKNRNTVSAGSPAKATPVQNKEKVTTADIGVGSSAPATPAGSPSRDSFAKARSLEVAKTTEAAASAAAAVAAVVPAIPFMAESSGGIPSTGGTPSTGIQAGPQPVDSEPFPGGTGAGHAVGRGGRAASSVSPSRSRSESPTWVYVGPQNARKARKMLSEPAGLDRGRKSDDKNGRTCAEDRHTRSSMEALMESSASCDGEDDTDRDDSDGGEAAAALRRGVALVPKRTPRRKPKAVAKANAKRSARARAEKNAVEKNATTTPRRHQGSNEFQEGLTPSTPEPAFASKYSTPASPKSGPLPPVLSPEDILELEEDRKHVEVLRTQLSSMALLSEEALKIARNSSEKDSASVNPANRARINKLSSGLETALKPIPAQVSTETFTTAGNLDAMLAQTLGQSFDLEKVDTLIQEFCKVLGQSQREADILLVLQLGCATSIVELCTRIKMSLCSPVLSANHPLRKQLNNAMLSSLKWLTHVSKTTSSRVFLLLTNRVVPLADVAVACLDAQKENLNESESQLFLPQILHILSQHVKQRIPDDTATPPRLRQTLVSYLLVCGLPEKLKDRFESAGIRGLRLFENSSSPLPLLFLRALSFLGTLTSAYKATADAQESRTRGDPVIRTLRRSELFGIVSLLVSILLSEGRSVRSGSQAPRLPQTVLSLCLIAVRILNAIARIDLATLQETLGACRAHELYHLLVCLLDYCMSRIQDQKASPANTTDGGGESREVELLHDTIVLLGHYCLLRPENQGIASFGEGQTLLAKITSLPLHYFMDERGRAVLFPTILATCFRSPRNLELLRNEMNLALLRKFITAHIQEKDQPSKNPPSEVQLNLSLRFPRELAQEALGFFVDE